MNIIIRKEQEETEPFRATIEGIDASPIGQGISASFAVADLLRKVLLHSKIYGIRYAIELPRDSLDNLDVTHQYE